MIQVTRLDGSRLYINAELVEFVESTPDTVLSLTTGRKIIVRERAEMLVDAILSYRQRVQGDRLVSAEPVRQGASSAGARSAAEE